ncbi:hypothetical protein [Demequina zhanjiangensis]|uniref:DUF3137 domain-containing protein n=1 Tax=Demequina zhanjiangensis TaxID=3051659 RepID=A0ABT8FZF2_9MICO|nr:hypothetical protein [Demequina sp. SYSU T00b26]MDN4472266.1 hypothetical protein [Demequina sp. SYSU T00b26]
MGSPWRLRGTSGLIAGLLAAIVVVLMLFGGSGGRAVGILLGISAGIGWFAWEQISRWRHRRELAEFATTHGWEYRPRAFEYSGRFHEAPFGEGVNQRQEDVLTGTFSGARCATFTHCYEVKRTDWSAPAQDDLFGLPVSNGRRTRTEHHRYHVTLVELPVTLPRLDIVPEGIADRVAKALGGRDVDVESHEFNRRWRVLADDPRYAHAVLNPLMIDRLLRTDVEGLALRFEGSALMAWRSGPQGVESLASRLGALTGVARQIREHVVVDYGMPAWGSEAMRPFADTAPEWATTPGALTSGRWTGIDPDAEGTRRVGGDFDILKMDPRTRGL